MSRDRFEDDFFLEKGEKEQREGQLRSFLLSLPDQGDLPQFVHHLVSRDSCTRWANPFGWNLKNDRSEGKRTREKGEEERGELACVAGGRERRGRARTNGGVLVEREEEEEGGGNIEMGCPSSKSERVGR